MSRSGGPSHLASSFTDLMTSLMVIFILLFVANINNAAGARTQAKETLLEELRTEFRKNRFNVDAVQEDPKDPYAIVIIFPDSLLFDLGSRSVRPAGTRHLQALAPPLSTVLCGDEQREKIESLVVEGHTDTTYTALPERGREYNLELSQRRSMEVVRVSLAALQAEDHRACLRGMMSASGRGQEEPLTGHAGDSEKQRRVVFKIRVKGDVAAQLSREVSNAEVR